MSIKFNGRRHSTNRKTLPVGGVMMAMTIPSTSNKSFVADTCVGMEKDRTSPIPVFPQTLYKAIDSGNTGMGEE